MNENKLPLGLCKQALMKLDSAMSDFHECAEDENINDEERLLFQTLAEECGRIMAATINLCAEEISEEDFLREVVDMDEIMKYPEAAQEDADLLEEEI